MRCALDCVGCIGCIVGALKRELRCTSSLDLHLSAAQLAMHHHGVVLYSIECVVHWTVWIALDAKYVH